MLEETTGFENRFSMTSEIQRIKARIYKLGVNPCVEVPRWTSNKSNPCSERWGYYRLYINGEMRKAAGVGVGDMTDVTLAMDDDSNNRNVKRIIDYLNAG